MAAAELLPAVSTRVVVNGHNATVRYVGPVSGQEGEWVGLEWDEPDRGRHDGSTGGERYFQTAVPGAGSFLRGVKLPKQARATLLEALKERYLAQKPTEEENKRNLAEMYVETAGSRRVEVQFVGEDKIRGQQARMDTLTSARLVHDVHIDRVGDATDLGALVPALTELNISGVLAPDWGFVVDLCDALPGLRVLNISDSRLTIPEPFPAAQGIGIGALRTLLLNRAGVSWAAICKVAPHLPNLEELHLESNGIAGTLTLPSGTLSCLRELRLGGNSVDSWADAAPLGALPSLEAVDLGGNPLGSIPVGAADVASKGGPGVFPELKTLLLGGCGLQAWSDVDALDTFAALKETRLTGNPVVENARTGGRFEVIARVSGLTMLNGAAVRESERRDSELRYMRQVLGELPSMNDPDQLAGAKLAHPRLAALIDRYGMPNAPAVIGGGEEGSTLSSSMVEVRLTCVAASAGKKMGTHSKKLPVGMEIGKLKLLCEKLFKLKVERQAIFLRTGYDPMPEEISNDDGRTLYSLGVQPNQEVLVDEFDPTARRKAEEAQRAEDAARQETLMAKQLADREAVVTAAAAAP